MCIQNVWKIVQVDSVYIYILILCVHMQCDKLDADIT